MVWPILTIMSLVLFALCCNGLIRVLTQAPIRRRQRDLSVMALRIERAYLIFAWGLATLFLFFWMAVALVQSVMQF